jgi:hypothetical protein
MMPSTAAQGKALSGSRNVDISSSPQPGDVVVTRENRSAVVYTIRQLPGAAQASSGLREEAVRMARSFAQKHTVDMWYRENGTDRLLEVYRARAGRQDGAGGSNRT